MNLISSPLTLNGKEVRMTSAKQSRSRMTGNYHVRFCMGVRGSDTPFDPNSDCGRILENHDQRNTTQGRRKARKSDQDDPFGHADKCPQAGKSPQPLAIATSSKAEVLRLVLPVPSSMPKEDLQSWGLSLAHIPQVFK